MTTSWGCKVSCTWSHEGEGGWVWGLFFWNEKQEVSAHEVIFSTFIQSVKVERVFSAVLSFIFLYTFTPGKVLAVFHFTFFRFHHLVRDSTQQCRDVTRDFSNLGASAGPLRGQIISLRLFHAAPVFSCVALLIWTWCIARVQTIV